MLNGHPSSIWLHTTWPIVQWKERNMQPRGFLQGFGCFKTMAQPFLSKTEMIMCAARHFNTWIIKCLGVVCALKQEMLCFSSHSLEFDDAFLMLLDRKRVFHAKQTKCWDTQASSNKCVTWGAVVHTAPPLSSCSKYTWIYISEYKYRNIREVVRRRTLRNTSSLQPFLKFILEILCRSSYMKGNKVEDNPLPVPWDKWREGGHSRLSSVYKQY